MATGGVGGAVLALVGGGVGGILGSAVSQEISFGTVDWNVAYLNGGINAITTGAMYFGLAMSGLYTGGTWMSRFMDAAGISEVGVGLSVFFATQNLPNPNDYRGRLNYFGW